MLPAQYILKRRLHKCIGWIRHQSIINRNRDTNFKLTATFIISVYTPREGRI